MLLTMKVLIVIGTLALDFNVSALVVFPYLFIFLPVSLDILLNVLE